ncbi:hypothetical protein R0131_01200 [Clostridium sp. AL.422]|uniref:hypothetical protein n=1 Tax=Clostridium TaxID=1485 RepID=UPI00293DA63A|nr:MULTISPECIES: hypothetical protein [unclassified Clostridium]MDV4149443.1 hypothetical protein [Clostridium sp. AL.422]
MSYIIKTGIFISLAAIAILGNYYEARKRNEYKNDERWKMIVSKSNNFTLNLLVGLSTIILFISIVYDNDFLLQFTFFKEYFFQDNIFKLLYVWGIATPYILITSKTIALYVYDKRI